MTGSGEAVPETIPRDGTPAGDALAALERAGVPYRMRKEWSPSSRELDIWLAPAARSAADAALGDAGFRLVRSPGHRDHRFYLRFDGRRWLKVDAKIERSGGARPVPSVRTIESLRRAAPASLRRLGPVIAVLGPDGAGKGSVIGALMDELPVAMTSVYHGHRARGRGLRTSRRRRTDGDVREAAFVVKKYVRSCRALAATYAAAWRGDIVLCDRHPIEALAVQSKRPPLASRLERLLVRRLTPWPDAIVVLDAPAETLFERKREHDVEVLERWRHGYLAAFGPAARVVPTTGPLPETVSRVSEVIWDALARRRGWRAES